MIEKKEKMQILFVDDDPNFLASVKRLKFKDCRIRTADGADGALALLRAQGPFPVVISDMQMPGMDGITLLGQIRKEFPQTVRLLFTGHADLETAIAAVNSNNVFRFLTKPSPAHVIRSAVADAVAQYRLLRDQEELTLLRKVREAMGGVIDGFVALVEARDPYTAGHQHRVVALSAAIAERMAMDADRIEGLKMASMVHDIGKLYVPAEFLNRPGALTEAEFAIIKAHPRVGFDVLSPVDFPWPISQIVLQHHERMDGSGYPDGLKGEQILLEARILAVADCVEAIASHRPYRPSLGIETALEEIAAKRGLLYDSRVVDACLLLFRESDFMSAWL